MEDCRIEFLRLQVATHLVESVLKRLEGIEVESLTVRNVLETRFGPTPVHDGSYDVACLAQLEIFASTKCRSAILGRIFESRQPIAAELTCQGAEFVSMLRPHGLAEI